MRAHQSRVHLSSASPRLHPQTDPVRDGASEEMHEKIDDALHRCKRRRAQLAPQPEIEPRRARGGSPHASRGEERRREPGERGQAHARGGGDGGHRAPQNRGLREQVRRQDGQPRARVIFQKLRERAPHPRQHHVRARYVFVQVVKSGEHGQRRYEQEEIPRHRAEVRPVKKSVPREKNRPRGQTRLAEAKKRGSRSNPRAQRVREVRIREVRLDGAIAEHHARVTTLRVVVPARGVRNTPSDAKARARAG